MIGTIWFLIKMCVFTLAVVTALQVRIGDKSVDGHLSHWMKKQKLDHRVKKIHRSSTQFVHRMWNKNSRRAQTEFDRQKKETL